MEAVNSFISIACAASVSFGALQIFQGATEIAKNRKQERPSSGGEWWTIVYGAMWVAFGASGIFGQLIGAIKL